MAVLAHVDLIDAMAIRGIRPPHRQLGGVVLRLADAFRQRKRPGNPFLPGSVVLSAVNSGLWAFYGEVSYERTGAGLA